MAVTVPERIPLIPAADYAALAGPDYVGWVTRMRSLGGCAHPIHLMGYRITRDASSGRVLDWFSSQDQPYRLLTVGCRNRREPVCPSCAYLHSGDTYQIVVSGLAGGKGVPVEVSGHPRVFATLTAPSFGPVHRASGATDGRDRCRVRRGDPRCRHGVALSCTARHGKADEVVGSPLCSQCYNYEAAVLWNAHVGKLWHWAVIYIGRALARLGGIPVRQLRETVRLSFARVVEFQARGSVHIHAVIRVDGPGGPGDPAPSWVTSALLADAVRAGVAAVRVKICDPIAEVAELRFGPQLDVQQIGAGGGKSDRAVAGYIAKYVTKGDDARVVLPNRLSWPGQIDSEFTPLSDHGRRMARTAWRLSKLPQYEGLHLRQWAHQCGFRGHIASKSRVYSVTYTELRAARAALGRPDRFEGVATVTESRWRYVDSGHHDGLKAVAQGIARDTAARRAARHGPGARSRAGGGDA